MTCSRQLLLIPDQAMEDFAPVTLGPNGVRRVRLTLDWPQHSSFEYVQHLIQAMALGHRGWTWWSKHKYSLATVLSKCEADAKSIEARLNAFVGPQRISKKR